MLAKLCRAAGVLTYDPCPQQHDQAEALWSAERTPLPSCDALSLICAGMPCAPVPLTTPGLFLSTPRLVVLHANDLTTGRRRFQVCPNPVPLAWMVQQSLDPRPQTPCPGQSNLEGHNRKTVLQDTIATPAPDLHGAAAPGPTTPDLHITDLTMFTHHNLTRCCNGCPNLRALTWMAQQRRQERAELWKGGAEQTCPSGLLAVPGGRCCSWSRGTCPCPEATPEH